MSQKMHLREQTAQWLFCCGEGRRPLMRACLDWQRGIVVVVIVAVMVVDWMLSDTLLVYMPEGGVRWLESSLADVILGSEAEKSHGG